MNRLGMTWIVGLAACANDVPTATATSEDAAFKVNRVEENLTRPGPINGGVAYTGRELDVAIEGEGYFCVQLADGDLAYTRRGNFWLDDERNLVTPDGFTLQPQITVPRTARSIRIGCNGGVFVLETDTDELPMEIGQITIYRFDDPHALSMALGTYLSPTKASGQPVEGSPSDDELGFGYLRQLHLEE